MEYILKRFKYSSISALAMKRKIIKQGHNTLTITLPSDWAKRFNLEAGKEIDMIERDNGLFISTEKNGKIKRAEFDITDMDIPTIWKYFMAVYREGYDELLIKFPPDSEVENPYKFFAQHKLDLRYKTGTQKRPIVESIQGFVNRFIGYEIIEHGKDHILIKEMGEITSKEFDNSLRRVFLLLQQMSEETLEAISTNEPKLLAHLHDVDINLDKFHDYCIRVLNKIGNKEPRKSELLFSTLYIIEMIGDEFKNIAFHITEDMKGKNLKNLQQLCHLTAEHLNGFYELFYNFDKEKMIGMSKRDLEIYMYLPKIYKKKNGKSELSNMELEILNHFRRISRYINALIELRIEMEF